MKTLTTDFRAAHLVSHLQWLVVALCLGAAIASGQDLSATATFNPTEIGAGQVGGYSVQVSGAKSLPNINPPAVQGLVIQRAGQSTQMSIINGDMSVKVTQEFRVRADKPGEYTIPAYTLTVNGNTLTIPAATLTVSEHPATPDPITLTLNAPRKDIYVGERAPLDVSIMWRQDLHPQNVGEVTQDNDSFENVKLAGNGDSSAPIVGGQQFQADTWHVYVTPLKAGAQSLRLTVPLVIMVQRQNDPLSTGIFGQNPFSFSQQEQVNIESEALDLNVLPLPDEGRPANFTGGIGTFSVDEPSLSATDLQVGVPVTLKLSVSGQGNFGRLEAPVLTLGSNWRSYTPKDSFQAQDALGYHGIKTFEYVLMPLSDNITELPAPEFNFFNPETKAYVELPLKPIAVKVQPAAPGQTVPLPALASAPVSPAKPQLVGLHIEPGSWQNPQPRIFLKSPIFWTVQLIPAAVLAALVITRRRQLRLENDPVFARRLQAFQQATADVAQARAAAAKGQVEEFYTIAQRALQEAATHDRLNAAAALTWQEFDAHLAAKGANAELRQQAREIFDAGDALRFGGYAPNQADLPQAAERLHSLVQKLLGRA